MAAKKAATTKKATATPRKKVTETAAPQGEEAAPVALPSQSAASSASTRSFTPITVAEVVEDLPATEDAAVSDVVVQAIIDADGKWVKIDSGGRKPNTARNNVVKALHKRKVSVKTRVIGEAVYVAVNS
jgi:hypothetical protein